MSRAKTKEELIEASQLNYDRLIELIQSLSEKELNTPFDFSNDLKKKEAHWKRDKNVRDILVHLYEWHNLMINWVMNNTKGIPKPFLMEGYNWRTYKAMNELFWERNQDVSLEEAKRRFNDSHQKIMEMIQLMSNDELFQKNTISWVKGSTLGSYFISVTSSHYDWAIKKIKAHQKSLC
ncbi:MAG: ClbS/DfsB family four-helix bundle protein [Traorella sp.]